MADVMPAYTPWNALAQAVGSQTGGATPPAASQATAGASPGLGGGINNFISALMKGYQGAGPPSGDTSDPGTYEGNIPSTANPYNPAPTGQPDSFGTLPRPRPTMSGQQPAAGPWGGGARPVPFLNQTQGLPFGNPMQALMSQPPMPGWAGARPGSSSYNIPL